MSELLFKDYLGKIKTIKSIIWRENASILFYNKKKIFVYAPRQVGATMFLVENIITKAANYGQIIITADNQQSCRDIINRIIQVSELSGIDHIFPIDENKINICGCEVLIIGRDFSIIDFTKKTLVVFDNYAYDIYLGDKLRIINNNINDGIIIDYIGITTGDITGRLNMIRNKIITLHDYDVYGVHFSETGRSNDFIKTQLLHGTLEQYL